jgi:beta-glucanase (GH16 family)
MENVGYDPTVIHATVHTDKYNHMKGTQKGSSTRITDPHNTFHTYTLDWTPTQIKGFVDGYHYYTFNKENSFEAWPFDQFFDIIINTAIGGNWGGQQGVDDSAFPKYYTIDYIRVYDNNFCQMK